jgi:hypothetical protein
MRLSNKRMKLTIVLAPPPRSTSGGAYACSPFGEHRTLAAYPRCSTYAWQRSLVLLLAFGVVAGPANAAGFVPLTPLFGLQYLIACGIGALCEASWLATRPDQARWRASFAVLVAKAAGCTAVMFGYLALWGGPFRDVQPLWFAGDLWAIHWFDVALIPVAFVMFVLADAVAMKLAVGSAAVRIRGLIGANVATQFACIVAFVAAAVAR